MSAGPLRRTTGTVGLVGLTPIAVMLVLGSLSAEQAALRAVAVLIAVLVVGNLARWTLAVLAGRFERHAEGATAAPAPGATGGQPDDREPAGGAPSGGGPTRGVHGGSAVAAGLGRRTTDRAADTDAGVSAGR